jgi:moderate conductance mechanosensitive channel
MNLGSIPADLPLVLRLAAILLLMVGAHLAVLALRRFGNWYLLRHAPSGEAPFRRRSKVVGITTIVVSASTFVVYFAGIGWALSEMGVPLTAYFASASVIGLAVGFGSQGLVQDVVIGLTLIFSDVLNVGDVVDISGQTGRVVSIGLRFTVMVNLLDQHVYVPNRNIVQINRYRRGHVRAYVDLQLPAGMDEARLRALVEPIAAGMHAQHRRLILAPPEVMRVRDADPGPWRFLRLKFRIWPGQGPLVENGFVRRALAALRQEEPDYADWMVTVSYRAD